MTEDDLRQHRILVEKTDDGLKFVRFPTDYPLKIKNHREISSLVKGGILIRTLMVMLWVCNGYREFAITCLAGEHYERLVKLAAK